MGSTDWQKILNNRRRDTEYFFTWIFSGSISGASISIATKGKNFLLRTVHFLQYGSSYSCTPLHNAWLEADLVYLTSKESLRIGGNQKICRDWLSYRIELTTVSREIDKHQVAHNE